MVVKVKRQKAKKKCVIKRKLEFKNYENCLEAAQLENKINHLEKNIDIDHIKENHNEFIRNNKSILKTLQRFKSKKYNVFTEEINKIYLSSNDVKRMQSNDLTETYAYGTIKGLVSEKEEIKYSNIKTIENMINFDGVIKEEAK